MNDFRPLSETAKSVKINRNTARLTRCQADHKKRVSNYKCIKNKPNPGRLTLCHTPIYNMCMSVTETTLTVNKAIPYRLGLRRACATNCASIPFTSLSGYDVKAKEVFGNGEWKNSDRGA